MEKTAGTATTSSGKVSSPLSAPTNVNVTVYEGALSPEALRNRKVLHLFAALNAYVVASRSNLSSFPVSSVLAGFQASFNALKDSLAGVDASVANGVSVDGRFGRQTLAMTTSIVSELARANFITREEVAGYVSTLSGLGRTPSFPPVANYLAPILARAGQVPAVVQGVNFDKFLAAWKELVANGATGEQLAAEALLRASNAGGAGWVLRDEPLLDKIDPEVAQAALQDVQYPPPPSFTQGRVSVEGGGLATSASWKVYAIYGGAAVLTLLALRYALKRR